MSSSPPWPAHGQRVVVTGASSGIGAATAVEFARLGATVGLVARRSEQLDQVLAICRATSPDSQRFVADLSELDEIESLAARLTTALGGIDVLVNNAGVPKRRTIRGMSVADAEGVMRMNYLSPLALTLAVLPQMLDRGSGHIVNVSSMGAHMVAYGVGAYSASKAALEYVTEAMYLELAGTGVHAHTVVPGTTRSEFSTPKDGNDPPFPSDPRTMAEPAEVAAAIVGCLTTDRLLTFATDRDRATAAARNADVDGFLAAMRDRLSGLGR